MGCSADGRAGVAAVTAGDTLTRTEAARVSVARGSRFRRWLRRRPTRRALVLAHRWTSLVLGLFLVIETTTGAVLLSNEFLAEDRVHDGDTLMLQPFPTHGGA